MSNLVLHNFNVSKSDESPLTKVDLVSHQVIESYLSQITVNFIQ